MRKLKSWRVLMPGWRASAQRVRRGAEVMLRWLTPVLALGEALLRCWTIIALVLLVPLALAFSSQGRQALFIATDGIGVNFIAFSLYALSVLLVGIYAVLILDMARSAARPLSAWLYAKYTAPQLLAATAGFSLPLLLRYGANLDLGPEPPVGAPTGALQGFMILLQFVSVAAIIIPTVLASRTGNSHTAQMAPPLLVIVLVFCVTFIFSDETSILLRYLILIAAILAANAFFPQSYRLAHQARRNRVAIAGVIALIYSIGIIWLAVHVALDPAERAVSWGPMSVILIAMLAWLCLAYTLDWGLWRLSRNVIFGRNQLAISAVRILVIGFIAWRLLTGAFNDTAVHMRAAGTDPRVTLSAYLDEWLKSRAKDVAPGGRFRYSSSPPKAAAFVPRTGQRPCSPHCRTDIPNFPSTCWRSAGYRAGASARAGSPV